MFFDDVFSEGLSKLEGIKPLEELGPHVKHLVVVVREQGGRKKPQKVRLQDPRLAKISEIACSLYRSKSISEEQADIVLGYIKK